MRIETVVATNFRLLKEAKLALDSQTTVIVGRNNSGKTSLSELVRRMLSENGAAFRLEDFSSACYDGFCEALRAKHAGEDDQAVRSVLPCIELRLAIAYEEDEESFGPLAPFVVDLDPDCTEAIVVVRYRLRDGQVGALFDGLVDEPLSDESRPMFFRALKERVPKLFGLQIEAVDPTEKENRRELDATALRALVRTDFISAQRGLDDQTTRETDVLARVLEKMFSAARSTSASEDDRAIADRLGEAVNDIQSQLGTDFANQLADLLPSLEMLGVPGLDGDTLQTETTLDVERLLRNFTKVRYAGLEGLTLPESYNGLGMRNLIFIFFQLVGFHKAYCAEPTPPTLHVVFIEEPEAHLHPQMQEVFIRKLTVVAKQLARTDPEGVGWPVQFVVSTHSSHVANEVGFESIRYFLAAPVPGAPPGVRQTRIKDLSRGMSGVSDSDKRFLHQYLTLTRCDLFFADKAILVEGVSERLMLPVIAAKLDQEDSDTPRLTTQYCSTVEVGGAYAHLFIPLLEVLELRTLIVTDLDSVDRSGGKSCPVHTGKATSNACIRSWFGGGAETLAGVMAQSDESKIRGQIRLAYQRPETGDGPCGRTFEDAFILANIDKFEIEAAAASELELAAQTCAQKHKKSTFALRYAIEDQVWDVPRYMADGLRWLASSPVVETDPLLASMAAVGEAPSEAIES